MTILSKTNICRRIEERSNVSNDLAYSFIYYEDHLHPDSRFNESKPVYITIQD